MPTKDPYKDSPYDASGMPLGAETVDYDNKDEVAKHTVKDKAPEFVSLADQDFDHSVAEHDWQKRTTFNEALNNTAIQFPGHRVHKKYADHLGTGLPEPKLAIAEDDAAREAAKEEPKEKPKEDDDFEKALKDA